MQIVQMLKSFSSRNLHLHLLSNIYTPTIIRHNRTSKQEYTKTQPNLDPQPFIKKENISTMKLNGSKSNVKHFKRDLIIFHIFSLMIMFMI